MQTATRYTTKQLADWCVEIWSRDELMTLGQVTVDGDDLWHITDDPEYRSFPTLHAAASLLVCRARKAGWIDAQGNAR